MDAIKRIFATYCNDDVGGNAKSNVRTMSQTPESVTSDTSSSDPSGSPEVPVALEAASVPARASMLTIYIEEAHAVDEWAVPLPRRTGGHINFAKNIDDRLQAARDFIRDHNYPCDLVCDDMCADANLLFDAWPERLYIIENGVIVYKGGPGPFEYEPQEILQWLQRRFDDGDSSGPHQTEGEGVGSQATNGNGNDRVICKKSIKSN